MQNSKKIFACTHEGCTSVFNRPYRLQQHELIHKNIKPFKCEEDNCTKSYTTKSHFIRHVNTAHKKMEVENDVIHSRENWRVCMKRFMNVNEAKEVCKCCVALCSVCLPRKGFGVMLCYVCHEFSNESCPECMKKYTNRQNLIRHIKRSHINISYLCDICKRKFKKKNQLTAHMFQHNGIKAFRCDFCAKDFVTLYEKKKHMRNHKTYDCEHCPAVFDLWSQYVKHNRTNHTFKEYICNDCGKSFKKKTHIVRHVKTHSRVLVRSFLCPFDNCERRYSRNSNLRQHILMKHERLAYECSICKAQLSTKSCLQKHILKVHEKIDVKIRVPKTLETGRNFRRDKNLLKCKIAALQLSGLTNTPADVNNDNVGVIDKIVLE